jgi:hypothetical protein
VIGTYRFYEDGKLVCARKNLITTEGSAQILRYFAGIERVLAASVAVGVGTAAAATSDTALQFEIDRTDVILVSPDFLNENIVFKARLPKEMVASIREVGLFSQFAAQVTGNMVANFTSDEIWDVGTFESANARVGGEALRLTGTAGGSQTSVLLGLGLDFSSMSANQYFKLAAYLADSNCDSIVIRFGTDGSNYYSFTVASPSSGYNVFLLQKSAGAVTGVPDWANITQLTVIVDAEVAVNTTVDLDGLRAEQFDIVDPANILISRAVLGTPITKTDEKTMDIEYELAIGVT